MIIKDKGYNFNYYSKIKQVAISQKLFLIVKQNKLFKAVINVDKKYNTIVNNYCDSEGPMKWLFN